MCNLLSRIYFYCSKTLKTINFNYINFLTLRESGHTTICLCLYIWVEDMMGDGIWVSVLPCLDYESKSPFLGISLKQLEPKISSMCAMVCQLSLNHQWRPILYQNASVMPEATWIPTPVMELGLIETQKSSDKSGGWK